MSADNGYLVRQRRNGKWVGQYANMSADPPTLDEAGLPEFNDMEDVVSFYREAARETEYGFTGFEPWDEKLNEILDAYPEKLNLAIPVFKSEFSDEETAAAIAQVQAEIPELVEPSKPDEGTLSAALNRAGGWTGQLALSNLSVEDWNALTSEERSAYLNPGKVARPVPPTTPKYSSTLERDLTELFEGYSVGTRSGTAPFLLAGIAMKAVTGYEDAVITQKFLDK